MSGPKFSCFQHCTACDILAQLSYLQSHSVLGLMKSHPAHRLLGNTHEVFFVTLLCTASSFMISCLTNSRDHGYPKLYLHLFSSAGHPYPLGFHFLMVQLVTPGRELKKMWSSLCVSLLPSITVLQCLLPSAWNQLPQIFIIGFSGGPVQYQSLCTARSGCPLLYDLVWYVWGWSKGLFSFFHKVSLVALSCL